MLFEAKALITLLAVANPLAVVPFFIHYTHGFDRKMRRRTVWVAAFTAFLVIALSALLGLQILAFFNISLASFQVGGGLLLLISAISMLNAKPAESRSTEEELHDAEERAAQGSSIAVVPLAIPLLTGPATMSTVVILSNRSTGLWQDVMLIVYGAIVALAAVVCFIAAQPIARVLGKTGINVMTRLMGLILAALAVEVMANGLTKLFPALQ